MNWDWRLAGQDTGNIHACTLASIKPLDQGLRQAIKTLQHEMATIGLCGSKQHAVEKPVETMPAMAFQGMHPDPAGEVGAVDGPCVGNDICDAHRIREAVSCGGMKQCGTHSDLWHILRRFRPEAFGIMGERD